MTNSPFVFLDPSGKRWPRLRLIGRVAAVLAVLGIGVFVYTIVRDPQLPGHLYDLKRQIRAEQHANPVAQANAPQSTWQKYYEANHAQLDQLAAAQQKKRRAARGPGEIRAGFFVGWDEESFQSLARHASQLTHVCPESMRLVGVEGRLEVEPNERLERFASISGLKLVPVMTNLSDYGWEPEAVEYLAFGPEAHRAQFIAALREKLAEMNAAGVLLDWEQMDPTYKPQLTQLLAEMAKALHADGRELWLSVPIGDDLSIYDLESLSDVVDHFVAQLHDENGEDDEPGPIASQDWFEGWLNLVSDYGDPSQWIVDIGNYGYDWAAGGKIAQTVSFADTMSRARYAEPEDVAVDAPSFNPSFSYTDSGVGHTVWFLDAATFLNQLRSARAAGAGGFLLTRLGTEDPQVWDALRAATPAAAPTAADLTPLAAMPSGPVVSNLGSGDVVSVEDDQTPGKRELAARADGRVTEHYVDYPVYPTLYHKGSGGGHEFTLTFDDGPDPVWTPKILDILRQRHVRATFFLIGQNAEANPGLVRRIVAEGHEIGSHTYTHPNLGLASQEQVRLELNATQRLVEAVTGRSTTLFRPPYDADSSPTDVAQLMPLGIADRMNYDTVLESIDPQDWAQPGAKEIVHRVKDQLDGGTNILLHDGGGDRSQTVKALPKIIDYIESRGDRVVPLHELIGETPDQVMPPLPGSRFGFERLASSLGFNALYWLQNGFWCFVMLAMALVVARTIIILALAVWHRRRAGSPDAGFAPPLSVLVPAYNEGKVIAATLRSVLATSYAHPMEVIVVDDGSTDDTCEAAQAVARDDGRVRVVRQANGGKAAALQRALLEAAHDVVVFIDADTRIARDAFGRLVQPLADGRVGAVSGHARVGNRRSFLARCQDLEYICGFNLDRRAYSIWNAITVAPGAISAFRKSAIARAGGFSRDTLAEDTDLTLAVHRAGFRVDYVPGAVAWTEAPETVRALAKQRFRWAFGTLQGIWKHRGLTFSTRRPGLGWFSLPSIWFFQLGLVAVAPLVDALFFYAVVFGHQPAVLPYFLAFIGCDLALALAACQMEGEPARAALRIIPMRFIYRPLLSFVVWKAILRALKGAVVEWGKLDRTASVAEVAP